MLLRQETEYAINCGATVILRRVSAPRTITQNKYYHTILGYFATQRNIAVFELKNEISTNCYLLQDNEGEVTVLRETSELNKQEFATLINWLHNYAVIHFDIMLPTSDEYITNRLEIDQEINRNKENL